MKKLVLAATCAACTATWSPVQAIAGAADIRGFVLFWAVDRDADGVVDRRESEALATVVFDAVDANRDGRVTREEAGFALVDDRPGADTKTAERLAKRREDLVVKLNLGKPEGTPRDEYLDRGAEMFDKADGDGSGTLDQVEFIAMVEGFEPLLPH